MTRERRTVVLLFGGRSGEHGISCVTAAGVLRAIDRARFDVIAVGVTKRGAPVLLEAHDLEAFQLESAADELPEVPDNGTRVLWPTSLDDRILRVLLPDDRVRQVGRVDIVFPLLHGPYGEDGTVQGLFELVGLPYVGCGVLASALCMDKHALKTLLAASGVAVAPWVTVTRAQLRDSPETLASAIEHLGYPLFVKPNRAGSSLGVTRVSERADLPAALEVAFAVDSVALVESGLRGREVEIAVLGGRAVAPPRTSAVLGEIVYGGRDFYDFAAKYLGADGIELVLPAQVSDSELRAVHAAAVRAFEVAGCAGLARIDFFLTADGPVVNEINTLPGFTPISMYPRLWQQSGLDYAALITELLELAIETHLPRRA